MNNLSVRFRREILIEVIIKDLESKGSFMVNREIPSDLRPIALIYYDSKEKRLVKGQELINYVCELYNVERLEEVRDIANRLEIIARLKAKPITVYNLYQWKSPDMELYISSGDGSYYTLKGNGKIIENLNGETIIFNDPGDYQKFEYLLPSESTKALEPYSPYGFFNPAPMYPEEFLEVNSIMFKLTALRCNFADTSVLSIEEQQILYYIVLHAMPFVTLLESVPIISAHGAPGAGKTFSMVQLAKFIFGREYRPEVFPEDREDFWTIIGNSRLYVFDNVEYLPKWVPDAIAAVATGSRKTKRARYTDWDVTKIDPRLFIFLTSVKAPYKQPAVVERLIPFVFEKFDREVEKEGSLSELFNPFETYRDGLMSQFIDNLDKIVAGIKKRGGLFGKTSHRMADFSILAEIINEELKLCPETVFKDMMDNLVKQRAGFAMFDNSWFRALSIVFSESPGVQFTATELANLVNDIIRDDGDETNAAKLGKYIKKYEDDMKTIFKLVRKNHSGKWKYTGQGSLELDGIIRPSRPMAPAMEGFEFENIEPAAPTVGVSRILDEFKTFFEDNGGKHAVLQKEAVTFITARTGKSQDYVIQALGRLRVDGTIISPKSGLLALGIS